MKKILFIISLCLSCCPVFSQIPGDFDLSFGGIGKVLLPYAFDSGIQSIAQQSNGKTLALGNLNPKFSLFRINQDGSLDSTFGQSGFVEDSVMYEALAFEVKIDLTGRLLITGYTRYPNMGWLQDLFVIRLLPDGTYDTTFGSNGVFVSNISQVASPTRVNGGFKIKVLSDSSILIGGFYDFGSTFDSDFAVYKINDSGQFDTSFGINGFVSFDLTLNDVLYDMAIQQDGKILFTGLIFGTNYVPVFRLNQNGSLDHGFGFNGLSMIDLGTSCQGGSSILQSSCGKILLSGAKGPCSDKDYFIGRLDSSGQIDLTFGINGFNYYNNGYAENSISMVELPDKNIFLSGTTGPYPDFTTDILIVCFDSSGAINTSFGNNGIKTIDFNNGKDAVMCTLIQPDGKLLLAGYTYDFVTSVNNSLLIRLHSTYTSVQESVNSFTNFTVYPNPAKSQINIKFENQNDLPEIVRVLDLNGRVVVKQKIDSSNSMLHIGNLPSAIYLLQIIDKGIVVGNQKICLNH